MNCKDLLLAFLVTLIWGISFSVIKVGLNELPPLLFSAVRFLTVAIPAILITPLPKTSIWNVIAIGILIGVVKFGLLFTAMKADAGAGASALLLQTQVFFTIALSYLFFSEKISRQQLVGIAITAIGFFFFIATPGGTISLFGFTLVTGAALAWAGANIVIKRMKGVNLLHVMIWASLIPPVPLFILSYLTETREPLTTLSTASPTAWAAVAYMGYLSTLTAYALWGGLLRKHSAVRAAPFALLIPVIGIVTSTFMLGERLAALEIAGAMAIMTGLAFCVIPNRTFRLPKTYASQKLPGRRT